MDAAPTSEQLVELFESGELAERMAHGFGSSRNPDSQLIDDHFITLHNSGSIDLLTLVEGNALQALNGTDFFMASYFFCRLLPELEATPARMMACVDALVTHGGQDGAANEPNAAFRKWCVKDPSRAREVIIAADAGEKLAGSLLTFALEALGDTIEARRIALTYNDMRCHSAITALGRMEGADATSNSKTLAIFNTLLGRGADDSLRASLLHAVAAIFARGLDSPSTEAISLVQRLVENAGTFTIHQSANVLWAYPEALHPDIVACLLDALTHIDPANKGTVDVLDLGLKSLLEHGYDEAANTYVTQLLSRSDISLELDDFDSYSRTLLSGPTDRLSRVVVRWLLLGTPKLCSGLANAIQGRALDGAPLSIQKEDLAISSVAQLFICRKAVGWFFLKPTTAASVIVAVLRICDTDTALEIQKLLVGTLLQNYGGVRDYLEGLDSADAAKGMVDQALAQNDAYLNAQREIPVVVELQPSEHQRRIERLRISDQMRDAHKQAESRSVLLNMVKRSVLLYGNRMLSFVPDGPDTLRPLETDLQSYGVSYEMPRMEVVDPVGLDYTLRIFRNERMLK